MTMGQGIPTRRPSPSRPDDDVHGLGDVYELLGQVMAKQASAATAIDAIRQEHETYTRTVVALHKDVRELLDLQHVHGRMVRRTAKAAPALIALLEFARYVFENFVHH